MANQVKLWHSQFSQCFLYLGLFTMTIHTARLPFDHIYFNLVFMLKSLSAFSKSVFSIHLTVQDSLYTLSRFRLRTW